MNLKTKYWSLVILCLLLKFYSKELWKMKKNYQTHLHFSPYLTYSSSKLHLASTSTYMTGWIIYSSFCGPLMLAYSIEYLHKLVFWKFTRVYDNLSTKNGILFCFLTKNKAKCKWTKSIQRWRTLYIQTISNEINWKMQTKNTVNIFILFFIWIDASCLTIQWLDSFNFVSIKMILRFNIRFSMKMG